MPNAIYRHVGDRMDYTPVAAVASGDVVVVGSVVGVATSPIAADALGSIAIVGVFDFLFATGEVAAQGVDMFWDTINDLATIAQTAVYLGKCMNAAALNDSVVSVKLVQVEGVEGTATASV